MLESLAESGWCAAAEMVSGFVKASSHNLKYCGIDALARVVRINAKYAGEHQARAPHYAVGVRGCSDSLVPPAGGIALCCCMCQLWHRPIL